MLGVSCFWVPARTAYVRATRIVLSDLRCGAHPTAKTARPTAPSSSQGPQSTLKSTAAFTLAQPWFTDEIS